MTEIEFLNRLQSISSKAQDSYTVDATEAKQIYLEALQQISNEIILRQQQLCDDKSS